MDQTEKLAFLRDAKHRMAQYTRPFLASVVGFRDSKNGEHRGTAFRCVLGGQRCAVTAYHVIVEAVRDFPGNVTISAGFGATPHRVGGFVRYDSLTDLAVIPLREDYPGDKMGVSFWHEDRIERSPDARPNDYLFLHGFPCAGSHASPGRIENNSFSYGAMEMIGADRLSILESFQFPMYFPEGAMVDDSGTVAQGLNPHGLSGSPVWRIGVSRGSALTWSPDQARLVGVITHWWNDKTLPRGNFLAATQASSLLDIKIDDLINVS